VVISRGTAPRARECVLGGQCRPFTEKEMSMYSTHLHELVFDECTPERMAAAGVPEKDALWYHTKGRHLARVSAQEMMVIMAIRHKVRCAR